MGYFSSVKGGNFAHPPGAVVTEAAACPFVSPDFGPHSPPTLSDLGITCVGAVSPILNFNIPLRIRWDDDPVSGEGTASSCSSTEASGAAASSRRAIGGSAALLGAALPICRVLAKGLSEQNTETGLSSVEALALPYIPPSSVAEAEEVGGSLVVEIACNLLNTSVTSPADVVKRLRELILRQAADGTSRIDSSSTAGDSSLCFCRDGLCISMTEAQNYTIGIPRAEQLRLLLGGG